MTEKRHEVYIGLLVPGGILPGDHVHWWTSDNTCSRCRRPVPEDMVPLLLWLPPDGNGMLIYCQACLEFPSIDAGLGPVGEP